MPALPPPQAAAAAAPAAARLAADAVSHAAAAAAEALTSPSGERVAYNAYTTARHVDRSARRHQPPTPARPRTSQARGRPQQPQQVHGARQSKTQHATPSASAAAGEDRDGAGEGPSHRGGAATSPPRTPVPLLSSAGMAWRSADESLALIGGLHGGMPAHEPESAPASRRLGGTAASDARPRGIGGADSLGRGASTAESLSQLEPPRGALGRALVVDDDPATRLICRRLLERMGYAVWSAADGDEGAGVVMEMAAFVSNDDSGGAGRHGGASKSSEQKRAPARTPDGDVGTVETERGSAPGPFSLYADDDGEHHNWATPEPLPVFDLILVDHRMPRCSGPAMLRRLMSSARGKAALSRTCVLVMSGVDSNTREADGVREESMRWGARGVLHKPVTMGALRQATSKAAKATPREEKKVQRTTVTFQTPVAVSTSAPPAQSDPSHDAIEEETSLACRAPVRRLLRWRARLETRWSEFTQATAAVREAETRLMCELAGARAAIDACIDALEDDDAIGTQSFDEQARQREEPLMVVPPENQRKAMGERSAFSCQWEETTPTSVRRPSPAMRRSMRSVQRVRAPVAAASGSTQLASASERAGRARGRGDCVSEVHGAGTPPAMGDTSRATGSSAAALDSAAVLAAAESKLGRMCSAFLDTPRVLQYAMPGDGGGDEDDHDVALRELVQELDSEISARMRTRGSPTASSNTTSDLSVATVGSGHSHDETASATATTAATECPAEEERHGTQLASAGPAPGEESSGADEGPRSHTPSRMVKGQEMVARQFSSYMDTPRVLDYDAADSPAADRA